jgi:UDP-N-acetylglucosamine 4,6-dehydratase/5-epimerase
MERIAVTGATGFIGEKLVDELVKNNFIVHAIARNEGKLIQLSEKHKGQIEVFPCSIEDYCLATKALRGCSGIYHLASSKTVELSEENTLKTIQTNIIGSNNLLRYTVENKHIKFIITTSTDKAAHISGTYAATKYLVEKLFQEFDKMNSENCKYRVIRLGNIIYSTSSVLEKWKAKITKGDSVILTDPDATRFLMTADDVISSLFYCLEHSKNAEPFIPKMKALPIKCLLDLMIEKYGNNRNILIDTIGLQKGENKHEFSTLGYSSEHAEKWSKEELFKLL